MQGFAFAIEAAKLKLELYCFSGNRKQKRIRLPNPALNFRFVYAAAKQIESAAHFLPIRFALLRLLAQNSNRVQLALPKRVPDADYVLCVVKQQSEHEALSR